MTQWDLAQPGHGARAWIASRPATLVMVLVIAVLFSCTSARAEPHPTHLRRATAARQVQTSPAHHAKPQNTPSKSRSRRSTSARRSAPLARSRHHAHPVPVDDHDQPVLHRASSPHGAAMRPNRNFAVAHPSRHLQVPTASEANPTSQQGPNSSTLDAQAEPLTVNDFLRAANAPESSPGGIYASGESHPEDEVSSSLARAAALTPSVTQATHSIVPTRVEAASRGTSSAPLAPTAPSDIVGAPLAPAEKSRRAASAENNLPSSELHAPSRDELTEEVERPLVLPGLYRNGRLVVPPPLRGTREILVHQNTMADDEGLKRVQDNQDLHRLRSARQLVDLPESASLHINPELAGDRRCARPWTVHFAEDVARAYYARFHAPLQVNSAVRTVAYQVRLRRVNGNAAGISGDAASPHLTGEALDFGKHGMSVQQIAWMRLYLSPLMQSGKLDVEEEFQQACFHVSVYRTYAPPSRRHSAAHTEVAQLREPRGPRTALRADQVQ